MKLDILDIDRLIGVNKLQPVTSPRLFSTKMSYDPDGVLSTDIFGISKSERRGTFAYINLNQRFLHPHIYGNIMKRMFQEIRYIVSGQRRYVIKDGQPVESPDGWTGIQGLYEHWEEINWKKRKSSNTKAIHLLSKLPKNTIFIDKILVCPPAYRDVLLAGTKDGSDHVSELNELYTRLIRSCALIAEGGIFAKTQYATQMKIQENLYEISNFFKDQISKTSGIIRKYLIGKSVDYGVRTVISAPTYNHNTFNNSMVDIDHTALPISQCCATYYPFIESWLRNFFTREIINDPNMISYWDDNKKRFITGILKDPESQFSDKNIRKIINNYMKNPDNRFNVISADLILPTTNETIRINMMLRGRMIGENKQSVDLNRPMTITDILYIACVEVCEKRHVMISRYPVGTDKGIFFNKIRVQSTSDHVHVIFNGKEYSYYPKIDLKTPREQVGTKFIDTAVFSNSLLEGMGGD